MSTILFKAEANNRIGGGHLSRSLILAEECKEAGFKVEFVFMDSCDSSIRKVLAKGYKAHKLDNTVQYEPNSYVRILSGKSMIVFDTDDPSFYSGALISALHARGIKTACFTITDKYEIRTDLLINPNIISETQHYRTSSTTRSLLSPKYMIFRESFRSIDQCRTKELNYPLILMLIFGSADTCHLTKYFLSIAEYFDKWIHKIVVVSGPLNPDLSDIVSTLKDVESMEIELHVDCDDMARLYAQCDVAITSAGMAMWEMALYCIPQMVIASSPRECEYSDYLSRLGYICKLGDYSNIQSAEEMQSRICDILRSKRLAEVKTREYCSIVNSRGVHLIVEKFIELLN